MEAVGDDIQTLGKKSYGHLDLGADITGGIERYAYDFKMNDVDFLEMIEGKKVLDLGSGYGGLAKECASDGVDTQIFSVNPKLVSSKFRNETNEYVISDNPLLAKIAQERHNSQAVAALAQRLPLADESINVILDDNAVYLYTTLDEDFRDAIKEELRVLKKDGKILMAALNTQRSRERDETTFRDLRVSYTPILEREGRALRLRGYVLTKTIPTEVNSAKAETTHL